MTKGESRVARLHRRCRYHTARAAIGYAMAAHEASRRTVGWAARWAYFMDIQRQSAGISRDARRKLVKLAALGIRGPHADRRR